jgi:hypothetical protein
LKALSAGEECFCGSAPEPDELVTLSGCTTSQHVFCIGCIRHWFAEREEQQWDKFWTKDEVYTCPRCRVPSAWIQWGCHVIPSGK